MSKQEIIRFRTVPAWKRRLSRLARAEGHSTSSFARFVLNQYILKKEAELETKKSQSSILNPQSSSGFSHLHLMVLVFVASLAFGVIALARNFEFVLAVLGTK
jgi:hypothetical protein